MGVLGEVGGDDVVELFARLHRLALLKMASHLGRHSQGLAVAARSARLPSGWQRKMRILDGAYGMARKLSPELIVEFLRDLDNVLEEARCKRPGGTGNADDKRHKGEQPGEQSADGKEAQGDPGERAASCNEQQGVEGNAEGEKQSDKLPEAQGTDRKEVQDDFGERAASCNEQQGFEGNAKGEEHSDELPEALGTDGRKEVQGGFGELGVDSSKVSDSNMGRPVAKEHAFTKHVGQLCDQVDELTDLEDELVRAMGGKEAKKTATVKRLHGVIRQLLGIMSDAKKVRDAAG